MTSLATCACEVNAMAKRTMSVVDNLRIRYYFCLNDGRLILVCFNLQRYQKCSHLTSCFMTAGGLPPITRSVPVKEVFSRLPAANTELSGICAPFSRMHLQPIHT